jgi:ABC-type lipoprotein export system ATPase subunit
MESLGELHRSGITILLVTHNEDLLAYTTRHIICKDGTIEG